MLYPALLCKFTVVSIFGDAMHLNSIRVRLCMAADKVAALSGLCMRTMNTSDFITCLRATVLVVLYTDYSATERAEAG